MLSLSFRVVSPTHKKKKSDNCYPNAAALFIVYLVNGELTVNLQVSDTKLAVPFVIKNDSVRSGGCRSESKDSTTILYGYETSV